MMIELRIVMRSGYTRLALLPVIPVGQLVNRNRSSAVKQLCGCSLRRPLRIVVRPGGSWTVGRSKRRPWRLRERHGL